MLFCLTKLLLATLFLPNFVTSLTIYNSSVPIENDNDLIGLKYLKKSNQTLNTKNGFSTCFRFNFRKLDSYLFYFGEANYSALIFYVHWNGFEDASAKFIGSVEYYMKNKKIFGFPWFGNMSNGESLMSVNKWNHFCISFGSRYNNITLILVPTVSIYLYHIKFSKHSNIYLFIISNYIYY